MRIILKAEMHYHFTDAQWKEAKACCEGIKGRKLTDIQFTKILDKILLKANGKMQEIQITDDMVLNS